MIEVIAKLQEAVSRAQIEAEKEDVSAAEAVDAVLTADGEAAAEAEREAVVEAKMDAEQDVELPGSQAGRPLSKQLTFLRQAQCPA